MSGEGETALTRVIAELPLADSLEEHGIRVVVVHVVVLRTPPISTIWILSRLAVFLRRRRR